MYLRQKLTPPFPVQISLRAREALSIARFQLSIFLIYFLGFFVHGDIFVSFHLYQAWRPRPSYELAVGFTRSLLHVHLIEILTPNDVEIIPSACADNAECPVH